MLSNPRLVMYAPWFNAPLPASAGYFLASCAASPSIQWVIHSDQLRPPVCPANVEWVLCGSDVRPFIKRALPVSPPHPLYFGHRLCDFKPWWYQMFDVGVRSEFTGWIDWDVLHTLEHVPLRPGLTLFTRSGIREPVGIKSEQFEYYPVQIERYARRAVSAAWSEREYLGWALKTMPTHYAQDGLTPGVDLPRGTFGQYATHRPCLDNFETVSESCPEALRLWRSHLASGLSEQH